MHCGDFLDLRFGCKERLVPPALAKYQRESRKELIPEIPKGLIQVFCRGSSTNVDDRGRTRVELRSWMV
jgi:hypothetical protein